MNWESREQSAWWTRATSGYGQVRRWMTKAPSSDDIDTRQPSASMMRVTSATRAARSRPFMRSRYGSAVRTATRRRKSCTPSSPCVDQQLLEKKRRQCRVLLRVKRVAEAGERVHERRPADASALLVPLDQAVALQDRQVLADAGGREVQQVAELLDGALPVAAQVIQDLVVVSAASAPGQVNAEWPITSDASMLT